jgi:hypothetical protein
MTVTSREVPDVAGAEIGDLPLTGGIDRGDATIALEHVSPFGGVGVPVQLAQRTWLERHIDAGQLV